eukprot:CAMPEP_0118640544 /NCGR_PEP_ID=MMETSP0785-20121206/4810_1 /TAXON_ID=91992 /ORGANISM="Bolidomonas pacifica, Strain CCMP 1866" /LENGTH=257 /DNA_ID=CAMNT_0006531939 /DNA_START=264 /DNA_END=1034 /DNA_ORIENTATION=+
MVLNEQHFRGDWVRFWGKVEWEGRKKGEPMGLRGVPTAKVNLIVHDAKEIKASVFRKSHNLVTISAPHVIHVGKKVLAMCHNLTEARFDAAEVVGENAFFFCDTLKSVTIPNVISIGKHSFNGCKDLRHIKINPNFVVGEASFAFCHSLFALAASTNFKREPGDGSKHKTKIVLRYLRWRNENDEQREQFHTMKLMLRLSNWQNDSKKRGNNITGEIRCTPKDRLTAFLLQNEDPAEHILSFFGEKRGYGDLRAASK